VLTYFACRWDHADSDDPVFLYQEIDEARSEVRKVHQYRDGRLVRTDRVSDLTDSLASEPIPTLEEIQAQREFTVLALSAVEFEAIWARATNAS
jgi:hypothetical protein